jgi:alpha-tubulin suppressor-like RCC1 family protein
MLRSLPFVLLSSLVWAGCPKGDPCGDLVLDPETESCVCPDGFTPRPELGTCEGPDGSVIRYDAGAGSDAGDQPDTGVDGGVDACASRTFYRDVDEDGFGNSEVSENGCIAPEGFVDDATDCDDGCSTCFVGATEVCDDRDNDCDGTSDEGVLSTFFRDGDGDTFGDPTMTVQACEAPDGYVANGDDCNDVCETCLPGGTELCDGALDENCSMGVDEGCACTNGAMRPCPGGIDTGACVAGTQSCSSGTWGGCTGSVGAVAETCDGLDNDCDATPDNGAAAASCGSVSRATGVGCSGGSCFVSACAAGFRDCDGMFANGCESQLGTTAACLACGDACGWDCEAAGCNDAVTLGLGAFHSCVIREDASALCWGLNLSGELGDGMVTDSAVPRPLATAARLDSVHGGGSHGCAIPATGGLLCWGSNTYGQVGDGTMTLRRSPVSVSVSSVVDVALGAYHSCVARSDGTVRCWGRNNLGQLGDGSTTTRTSPVAVATGGAVASIAASGSHTCAALKEGGGVRCWGYNAFGQLGDNSTSTRTSPVAVSGLSSAISVAVGRTHSCALLPTGTVSCWGGNTFGQLGDGSTTQRRTPVAVVGLSDVVAIASGGDHTCARRSDSTVWCWGSNGHGQLGDGSMTQRTRAVQVASGVADVAVGGDHSCAISTDGGVRCWGRNDFGQVGDGTLLTRLAPTSVLAP